MTVYFIGAGPGDAELITVKGQRLLERCPVVIYAGSLVPPELLAGVASDAEIRDSAPLHLEQIIELMKAAQDRGQDVARLHSGDPSLYGAVGEQMRRLDELGIPFEMVPGVTAVAASAAMLKRELTVPGRTQTVIFTRYAGKTPMPEREALPELARHGATLAIHLGVAHIHRIVEDLQPHYGQDCPVVVAYRVGWPDQDWVGGTLGDIVGRVRERGFVRTALILVGRCLLDNEASSWLYNQAKAHIHRPRYGQRRADRELSSVKQ